LRQRAQQRAEVAFGGRPAIPDQIAHLRNATAKADCTLTPAVYSETKALFLASPPQSPLLGALIQLAPEYGRSEYLRSVAADGEQVLAMPRILADYRKTVASNPEFELWFREATTAEDKPVLLAARWLCHLVGLRHPTAELFIDHPSLPDHTLVQVRGLGKVEAPGCFDLPSAGHVVGTETAFDTLLKEMKEELNLEQGDILELTQIGSYPFSDQVSDGRLCNTEYRTVYRGRLADDTWPKLRFADGEVAAIGFFSLPALRELLDRHPERVASGLAQSLATYLETANRRVGEGA
jgi:8-oxo-dGTP pyrophosphatase MutT (NUDIX family)